MLRSLIACLALFGLMLPASAQSVRIKDLVEVGTWKGATLDPALSGRKPDKSLTPKAKRRARQPG